MMSALIFSFPAAAEEYPVNGVWAAVDTDYPAAANLYRYQNFRR
jgi:hypothetical protein